MLSLQNEKHTLLSLQTREHCNHVTFLHNLVINLCDLRIG